MEAIDALPDCGEIDGDGHCCSELEEDWADDVVVDGMPQDRFPPSPRK